MARIRRERALDLNIRIGLASGPVMAGIIGRQKFSYDVWGDAVNLAARLEALRCRAASTSARAARPGSTLDFEFESRGTMDIKGVGQQETWFLVGARMQRDQAPQRNKSSAV